MAEKRSLFQMIFGNRQQNPNRYQELQLLNGYQATWTNYDGEIYNSSEVRSCIDAIARNGAKLNPKHIRYSYEEGKDKIEKIYGRVQRLIGEKPNELMNAYSFYYKVISNLYLNNNAFIFIQRDEQGEPTGLYPINANMYKLLEYGKDIYVEFYFANGGKTYIAPLKDDIIHLRKFYCKDDILGGSNAPIIKTMSLKHIVNEGIINAIKTTQSIKGLLKTEKAMLKPEDVKKMRDTFVRDFMDSDSNIGALDSTMSFTPVNINPATASDGQVKSVSDEILNYFGVNQNIIQSNYNEEQWNAFYESVLEPLALEMSLEFTNKIFSYGERWHGNKIVFEANRLQYASNNTKINTVKTLLYYGCLTKNEAREIFNMSAIEGGDELAQSLATTDGTSNDGINNIGGNDNE